MYLKVKDIEERNFVLDKKVEMLGEKFILITVEIQYKDVMKDYMQGRIFHWRLCDGISTPYDISLNSGRGDVAEITFFIEDKTITTPIVEGFFSPVIKSGSPMFESSKLYEECFYEDEKGNTDFSLFNNTLYCIFSNGELDNIEIIKQNDNIEYLISKEKYLIGIGICKLSEEELTTLREAKVLLS